MARPIAYNIVRMLFAAANGVPRGIDRIDFGWLSHLFETWPADCFGVLPTPWGVRIWSRDHVLRGRDRLAKIWRECDRDDADPAMARLRAVCTTPSTFAPRARRRPPLPDPTEYVRVLRFLLAAGPSLGAPVGKVPRGALYLDIAQRGLMRPETLDWLDRRDDVSPVFLIHDVIPLRHPELASPGLVAKHARILDTTARRARAVLTSTTSAAAAIRVELDRRGRPDLPIHIRALPIDDVFRERLAPDPIVAARPYCLTCGVVVPRKNQAILIEAWTRMIARADTLPPRLVIAGATGGAHADALRRRVADRGLAEHVVFASGLSTPSIARLMAGARALLMPSRAEGFGLPPLEAIATGTPAVVSDIPAHRDSAGDAALFVDPDDVEGWIRAVEDLTPGSPVRTELERRMKDHRSVDWTGYMTEIGEILSSVA